MIIRLHSRRQHWAARGTAERAMIMAVIVLTSATSAVGQSPEYLPQESIGALQHHQPIDNDVLQREIERYGRRSVEQQQRREDAEIGQLYSDILRRSAPSSGEDEPHEMLSEPPP
jgi:hypothetical protein